MKVPEGRQGLSSNVNPKLYERARIAAVKRKIHMPAVLDEALKLWLEAQKDRG